MQLLFPVLNRSATHTRALEAQFPIPSVVEDGTSSPLIESLCRKALVEANKSTWRVTTYTRSVVRGVLEDLGVESSSAENSFEDEYIKFFVQLAAKQILRDLE